jgi:predicted ABC-type ATPase
VNKGQINNPIQEQRIIIAGETTLSGRRYARMIPQWQSIGYRIKLVFLYLQDVKIAIERVRVRVRQGGHDVPEDVILRRYDAGWRNFNRLYKGSVDSWALYDNSGETPLLVDAGGKP